MRTSVILVSVLLIAACTSDKKTTPGDTTDTKTSDTDSDTDTDTTDTGPTTTNTQTTTFDCTAMPPKPTTGNAMTNIPSTEDFTIDKDGYVWGVSMNNNALVRTLHDGQMEIMLPNVSSWGRGTRFLPDGNIVIAEPDRAAVVHIDISGPQPVLSILVSNLNQPNGIAVDPNGIIYVTTATGQVVRADPATGDRSVLYDTPVSTDGISFAPDYRTLYWNSEFGEIIKVELDVDGNIVSGPNVFAQINGFLDGMTVDFCGNIYVVDMGGRIIRIDPQGQQEEFINISGQPGGDFISAVNFGSGAGGFERENFYIMSFSNVLFEIEAGIPGKWEPHY